MLLAPTQTQPPPTINIPQQRAHLLQPMSLPGCILITQSPYLAVHSWCYEFQQMYNDMYHHYSIIQSISNCLKNPLCSSHSFLSVLNS